jgi:hypothetical protein
LNAGYSGEEFVGYLFEGSPERRPRLWFLDRHLISLTVWGQSTLRPDGCAVMTIPGLPLADIDVGKWTVNIPWRLLDPNNYPPDDATEVVQMVLPGLHVRYDHAGEEPWSAVWELTDVTIPSDLSDARRGFGVTTFGRDDDVWRLGLWPD